MGPHGARRVQEEAAGSVVGDRLLASVEPAAQATLSQSQWLGRTPESQLCGDSAQMGSLEEKETLIQRQP